MTRLMAFLTAKDGIPHSDFLDHYEHVHVPLIRGIAPGIASYRRHYLNKSPLKLGPQASVPCFDVVTELSFADEAARRIAIAALADASSLIRADEQRFLNVDLMCLLSVDTRE